MSTNSNTTKHSPERRSTPHIHDLCKIYVNLTGNASFIVEIISCIAKGLVKYNVQDANKNLPQNIQNVLNYINKNYSSIKNINELASTFHISITTLERYFKKHLSMTPKRYLEDKKLSNACMMLRKNSSVTEACFDSGFEDYSHFITIFKKNFQTTPSKYKKNILNS